MHVCCLIRNISLLHNSCHKVTNLFTEQLYVLNSYVCDVNDADDVFYVRSSGCVCEQSFCDGRDRLQKQFGCCRGLQTAGYTGLDQHVPTVQWSLNTLQKIWLLYIFDFLHFPINVEEISLHCLFITDVLFWAVYCK